jgi:Barstar (barnase inhibitor)
VHNERFKVDTSRITDWETFHTVFADVMGFPEFYGRNMDAWIDCMTYLDAPEAGMTRVLAKPGELFPLEIEHARDFQRRLPDVFATFIDCAAFVNWRRVETGEAPVLSLVLI